MSIFCRHGSIQKTNNSKVRIVMSIFCRHGSIQKTNNSKVRIVFGEEVIWKSD